MFQVGDRCVYPLHGVFSVEAIEEREFLGGSQLYYILEETVKSLNGMCLMIPFKMKSEKKVRLIVDTATMKHVLLTLFSHETDQSISWRERCRINTDKMGSGDIYQETEVIRDLTRLNEIKKLGMAEKDMLQKAIHTLMSELALVNNINEEQARDLLQRTINEH
ncbi:CarD family transcriptional regulator [Baia soyae]|uniref:CarD family transcriptional regulator n=1 Tax=Baia soyae TaxID=1544746 RepID=A0A4R2RSF2_9BACL|nr:CarD family transcriptional regulator [Baia soyae]TCP62085.1 CarD family transcriptional regulator [Baia soyae]